MWGVVGLTTKDECLNSPPKETNVIKQEIMAPTTSSAY